MMEVFLSNFLCKNKMKSFFINIICFVLAVNGAAQQDVSWFDVDGYIIQANNSLLKTADTGENNSGAISANILNAGGSGWMELCLCQTRL